MGQKAELRAEVQRLETELRYLRDMKAAIERSGEAIRTTLRAACTVDTDGLELDGAVAKVIRVLQAEIERLKMKPGERTYGQLTPAQTDQVAGLFPAAESLGQDPWAYLYTVGLDGRVLSRRPMRLVDMEARPFA